MLKRWLVALGVFLVAAGIILPPLAADMDFFFTRQFSRLTWKPPDGWAALLGGGKPLRFYLILCALVALLLLWILFTGSYLNYKNSVQVITPKIRTPLPAGNGEFGTAHWLKEKDYSEIFKTWVLPKKDAGIQALVNAGKKDRQNIQHTHIEIVRFDQDE